MIQISRTTSTDKDFLSLIKLLDAELWERYPEIQDKYEKHSRTGSVKTVVIARVDDTAVACGCFIAHDSRLVEIKRMFVDLKYRGRGIAKMVLNELENWATELGYTTSILETGRKQPEAVALYKKLGYRSTHNFGPYKNLEESLCFSKDLQAGAKNGS